MKYGTMYVEALLKLIHMMIQDHLILKENIRNENEYISAKQDLKTIYKEILRLVIKKEEYEERIDEYLNNKT